MYIIDLQPTGNMREIGSAQLRTEFENQRHGLIAELFGRAGRFRGISSNGDGTHPNADLTSPLDSGGHI
jgi:hypothetical protein